MLLPSKITKMWHEARETGEEIEGYNGGLQKESRETKAVLRKDGWNLLILVYFV